MVERYGDADTVQARDMPDPIVGDDDALVRIHAASVNPLDFKIRSGDLKVIMPYRAPFVLGNDLAGTVAAVGSRVTRFAVGDDVYARPDQNRIGAFAEFIAMRQDDVAAKPATLTMEEAASIPLVGLTAWQALVERANLRPGQRSSSTPGPAASAPSPSSWPNTSALTSPRPRAARRPTW